MHFKNLLKVSCCFILLCLFALPALAQNVVVTGKVTDSKDGSPIPGVSIVAKGSTAGTVTDVNGNFKLSVPSSVTAISVSFVGYNKKDVPLTGAPLNITLDAASTALNEVLVVGYGTVRKKDATGAVVKVSSSDFVQGVTTNPLQQLQGKAAGVVINTSSGDPNDNPTVRIRGTVSLSGGNDPLYVIDGVVGADIRSISPNDIESYDILKDASGAAIYGSRAAGGVILITTKSGKAGRMRVEFNSYIASESPEKLPDFMNRTQYLSAYQSFYGHPMKAFVPDTPSTTADQGANTNWFKQITRSTFTHNENLALSGGTEKGHYRASATYTDQPGILLGSDRKDLQGRFNFDQKALDDKLLITISASGTHTNGDIADKNAVLNAAAVPSVISVTDPNHPNYYQFINNTQEANPVPQLVYIQNKRVADVLNGRIQLDYTLAKGLTISPYANVAHGVSTYFTYYPPTSATSFLPTQGLLSAVTDPLNYTPTLTGHGDVDKGELDYTNATYGGTINYKATFGKSRINVLGGAEHYTEAYSQFRVGAHDFNDINQPNEAIGSANSISTADIGSNNAQYILKSLFGRLEYNLADKYNFTANIRYDNSNKLGLNNQSGVFPSFGASWTISQEDFMKGVQWINSLKLRASYGSVGDQGAIGDYTSQFLFGPNGQKYYDGTSGLFLPAAFAVQNANSSLRWEVVTSTDIATDFSLFNGRLNGTFDWYSKKTNHLLYPYTVPTGSTYFVSTILANIGSMSNKGFEFSLNYKAVSNSDFSWTPGINFGLNRNKILNLSGSLNGTTFNVTQANVGSTSGLGISGSISNIAYLKVGYPVGTLLLPTYAGITADGQQEFWKYNADGSRTATTDVSTLNYSDDGSTQDRKFYTTDPKFTYSINNSFTYKQFDLNIFLRGQYGSHAFNEAAMDYTSLAKLGTYGVLADATQYGIKSASEPSSFWWQGTSFLKVQSLNLGYSFKINDNKYIDKLHIYVAGNNLYTFTKYKGVDPEVNNAFALTGSSQGIDIRAIYPRPRELSFGVNMVLK